MSEQEQHYRGRVLAAQPVPFRAKYWAVVDGTALTTERILAGGNRHVRTFGTAAAALAAARRYVRSLQVV